MSSVNKKYGMDPEDKKLETTSLQESSNKSPSDDAEVKEDAKGEVLENNDSGTHVEEKLDAVDSGRTENVMSVDCEVNSQAIVDGENTQMITSDDCTKEGAGEKLENIVCETQIAESKLQKEDLSEAQTSRSEEAKSNGFHDCVIAFEAKPTENLDETLVIESDDEIKPEESGPNERNLVEVDTGGESVKEEIGGEKSLGEISQATTVEIGDLDIKPPHSPEDLFASQSQGITTKQTDEDVMDCEDVIPSSLPTESEKPVTVDLVQPESSAAPRKRKLDEVDKVYTDSKVPRMKSPTVASEMEIPKCENDIGQSSDVDKSDEVVSAQVSVEKEVTPEDTISEQKVTAGETSKERGIKENSVGEELKESEVTDEKEKEVAKGKERNRDNSTRNSVEIVFSSVESSEAKETESQCAAVPNENGEEYDDVSEDEYFRLRMSFSPSQLTQSFNETEVSKGEDNLELESENTTKNSVEDSGTSHNDVNSDKGEGKSGSTVNSHSSNDSQKLISSSAPVDESSEVQIISENKKVPTSSDEVIVLQNTENDQCVEENNDTPEVVFVSDKNDDSAKCSGLTKHRDMNGTLLKRKHPGSEEETENHINDPDKVVNTMDSDLRKRTRLGNQILEDRSSPDLPLLLPNKDSPSVVGREVEFALKCHLRLQMNEETRQVNSIEILQCQDIEDLIGVGILSRTESSSGYVADESKNSSPSSVMSLGPFPLKAQSRFSSSSTSTASSGHSLTGVKSKSSDWPFTAPLKPAPSRNNRTRNVHCSTEFVRDLFELVEKRLHVEESEPRSTLLPSKISSVPPLVSTSSDISLPETVSEEVKDFPESKCDAVEPIPETPKSTKKLYRGTRNTRNVNRSSVAKLIKEEADESSQPATEKEAQASAETPGSQKKPRKAALRTSKRTGGSTPSTPTATDEPKVAVSTGPPSRSRRNRTEQTQSEKKDSSSQESHVFEWDSEGCFSKLVTEAPVFARWTDKKYYPGKIKEKTKDGRWIIQFDDHTVRPSKEEFIIPINILPKGQIVFASDDDAYEQGIIVEFKLKDGEVHYGVDLDSGKKLFVPRSKLFMSEDQARLLQEGIDPKTPTTSSPALTTVSCDNIVHHKRPRSNRVLFGSAESPSVSGVAKTPKRSGKTDPSHDTSCSSRALPVGSSSSVSDNNDKGPTLTLEEVSGIDPEVPSIFPEMLHTPSGRGKGPGRIKSKTRTPRRNVAANHSVSDTPEHNTLHEMLGPIPEKGSKIFSGMCFLLTLSGAKAPVAVKPSRKSDKSVSSEVSSDENSSPTIYPFIKEHLMQQIEAGGGVVYENFEDVPEDQYQNCFLVAERPSLTAKYVMCLASGIRIIRHGWVIQQAMGINRAWMCARLEAGLDVEDQRYVSIEMRTRKQKPLNKKEVGLVNDSQPFIKFWGRVLELLGANVRHIAPEKDREFSGVNVIVTDSTCPPEVQDRAREWGIPLVSTVWVTQSLINWRIRSYTGHPHYRYDYCPSD